MSGWVGSTNGVSRSVAQSFDSFTLAPTGARRRVEDGQSPLIKRSRSSDRVPRAFGGEVFRG